MSAFRYLVFVFGIALVAIFGMVINQFVNPILDLAASQSSTQASATGVTWFTQAWEWIPAVALLMLVFALLVGIIVRRNTVRGGI